jgi:protein-L-isoaspartate O-methyltransferase
MGNDGGLEFSGERFVLGAGGARIASEHFHRYVTAIPFVKDQNVVDIGSGSGYGSQILSAAATYVGVDEKIPLHSSSLSAATSTLAMS